MRASLHAKICFHGDLDIGESLTVVLCGIDRRCDSSSHWCEIVRSGDGRKVADVFTIRATSASLTVAGSAKTQNARRASAAPETARSQPQIAQPEARST